MSFFTLFSIALLTTLLLYIYIRSNDSKLLSIPARALGYSPVRVTPVLAEQIRKSIDGAKEKLDAQVPPRTGRRYVVTGGAGFLGGWLVLALIKRGEDPKRIRVLDIQPPRRKDLLRHAKDVDFRTVDMSDYVAVLDAFKAPWPLTGSDFANDASVPPITVFHCAANIRFYERHDCFYPLSSNVNVLGTENIILGAKAIGAMTLVYTSSGSITIRSSRYFLWPWEVEPKGFVQVMREEDIGDKSKWGFSSNYSKSKWDAETLVREADRSISSAGEMMRTGCIRPGNGVFGGGGDMLFGATLNRGINPTWVSPLLQSCIYVENCVTAHLLYEQRLIQIASDPPEETNPDIGGQAFVVCDPGPPPTNGDIYTLLETLSGGAATFLKVSPTLLLMVAYGIETYYLARHVLITANSKKLSSFARQWLPEVNIMFRNLQPAIFMLTAPHVVFDDSKARMSKADGGLGYTGVWTTLEGVAETVAEWKRGNIPEGEKVKMVGWRPGFNAVAKKV